MCHNAWVMKPRENRSWTADALLELGRSYQVAAVFAAAADLEVFEALAERAMTAAQLRRKLKCDQRGMTILLDALAALGLLAKTADHYQLQPGLASYLTPHGAHSILGMAQHQANCMRRWAQLAVVVKTGQPAERTPSVRGESGDGQAFIEAMHNLSLPVADEVIAAVAPLKFKQVLDLGGASGTWTLAFLRACRSGRAVLYDLPSVIPMARRRLSAAKMMSRVRLVAGDFLADDLPGGNDLAWVSAIVHQNSQLQNRAMFKKIHRSLIPGGRIAIRDLLMDETRTRPIAGALFAVNMLVGTVGGGTYTLSELRDDLEFAGFTAVRLARRDEAMNAVLVASKR
jgi:predicted O-methyltransferase YrrM